MHLSIITMSILLAFGIWSLAGEPRLKFTDLPSPAAADQTLGTAPVGWVTQN